MHQGFRFESFGIEFAFTKIDILQMLAEINPQNDA